MSTDTHSVKAKVASDGPQEAPQAALPDQSNPENSSGQKVDMMALAKEISEELENMTEEEKLERFPWTKNPPPPGVDGATAMRILEEMERKEAADSDEDETTGTGAGKAS